MSLFLSHFYCLISYTLQNRNHDIFFLSHCYYKRQRLCVQRKSSFTGNDVLLFITELKGFTLNEISPGLNNSNRVFIQYFLKVCCFTYKISWMRHFFEQFYT